MPYEPGQMLVHYRLQAKIGAGGMGEVYRATDTKLGREVAIKVLPEALARDADRLARFRREAQLLASLNHPAIAAIFGVEEAAGALCLVLELVEGPTLAERIQAGAIPVQEALPLARQIAEALEAAHEKGIIHRDLKPANIKLTPAGAVKVLDFGLAKALGDDAGADAANLSLSPTLTAAATRAGIILGTAGYMSPEQAKGRATDRRGDIWAFGAVLFEMLAGRQAFPGESVSEALASVIKSEPEWETFPDGVPPALRRLLKRCLEKDPLRRLRDIGEARIAIDDMLSGRADEAPPAAVVAPVPGRHRAAWIAAMLLVVAAAAGAAGWYLKPEGAAPPLRKSLLVIEDLDAHYRQPPALSPDGRRIVYASHGRLWIRDLDQLESRELAGAVEGRAPFWSPDSTQVAFGAKGRIWRSAVSGGQASVVCDQKGEYDGGAWTADGTIVFVPRIGPMYRVPAMGGDPEVLLEPDVEKESDFHKPHALPGGRGLVFSVHRTEGADTLAVLADGRRKTLLQIKGQRLDHPAYSPSGHLLYRRSGTNSGVWAVPFSLSRLETSGEPFLIAPGGDVPSVAADGTLAFAQSDRFGMRQLVRVDRSGRIIEPIGQPQNLLTYPSVSSDGRHVAVSAFEAENADVWIHDVVRGTRTRLTFDPQDENPSAWRPGSDQVAFWRTGKGIWVKRSDGTGEESQIAEVGANASFTPDGRTMIYHQRPRGPGDLMTQAAEGGQKPAIFLSTEANEADPAVSPDGRYVAYESDESGREEVYLKQFPGGEGKWQVSVAGGRWPVWSRQGKEIFYQGGEDALFAVAVEERPTLTLGNPRKLFGADQVGVLLGGPRFFDVAPDGTFVMIQPIRGAGIDEGITLVQNWFAEFSARK